MIRIFLILGAAAAAGLADAAIRSPLKLDIDAPAAARATEGAPGASAAPASGRLTLAQARELHADPSAVFVDASLEAEFRSARIPGAQSLPPDAFSGGAIPDVLTMISRDATVVVYCRSDQCDAAVLVALRLREFGYAQAVVFEAGLAGWAAAGLPVERGP